MIRKSINSGAWIFRLVGFLFAGAVLLASINPSWAEAQSANDIWEPPVNLSHSGVAVSPGIAIDSEGIVHAVWQDELANFLYTRFDGDQWSAPQATNLNRLFRMPIPGDPRSRVDVPLIYTGPNPLFIAGPGEYVFAFWISSQGTLFTSRVQNQDFANLGRWVSARVIARDTASFAAAIDASGEFHLAYIRTVEDSANPAGLYYTRSKGSGSSLTAPVLLYQTPYFRTLEEGEANISLATAGTEEARRVYLAWDNRPRKQVFLAQSVDGGANWEEPRLVAGPEPFSGSSGPFNIRVGASPNSVLLLWQDGQPDDTCTQFYQSSSDAGVTWSDPAPMMQDLVGCARSNEFVTALTNGPDEPIYFLTGTTSQSFLLAWTGLQWSQPQEQPILSGFEEPEIYTDVVYGCHRAVLFAERLYVIGCDEGGGGDVWVTSRDLASDATWSAPPAWSQLSPIASDSFDLVAVELVSTDDGLIHAFFSQHQDPAIYYSYWDGERWSGINPVLKIPEGEAGWPVVTAMPSNELFLIARNNAGTLYFSRARSGSASRESLWSTPARLGIGFDREIGSMDMAWESAGMLYVAYSIPVNEERGIYFVQSKDHGATWSEPLQVFNGEEAGFELVGAPSLLLSDYGVLHIMWRQQSIQGDGVPQPVSLYYARSEDGGRTFSNAQVVVDEPVAWQEIVMDGQGNLHLLWRPQDNPAIVWDQLSLDGGRSWQIPQGLPNVGTTADVMVDSEGHLHLVDAGSGALGHWVWNGSRWQTETPLRWSLDSQSDGSVASLAATVSTQGEMVVVLAVPAGEGDASERNIFYSTQSLELPSDQTDTENVPTPTLLPPTLNPVEPTAELLTTPAGTAASELSNPESQTDPNGSGAPISPFIIALVPVALLLLSVLGIVIRRVTQLQDR